MFRVRLWSKQAIGVTVRSYTCVTTRIRVHANVDPVFVVGIVEVVDSSGTRSFCKWKRAKVSLPEESG